MVLGFGRAEVREVQALESPDDALMEQDILDMAKYLGMDLTTEFDMLHIAKEAYMAPLPPQWTAHRDKDGSLYYYNVTTDQSQYQHPMDEMYRARFQAEREKRRKLREIAETKKKQLREEQLRKQIAIRLNNQHNMEHTIEEIYDMCRFLKMSIDDGREFCLVWVARRAVVAVLPEVFDEYEDDSGRPYYHNRETDKTTREHPNDAVFFAKTKLIRDFLQGKVDASHLTPEELEEIHLAQWRSPWIEMKGRTGGFCNILSFERRERLWFTESERIRSAVLLQRVWRGYKVRATVALEFTKARASKKIQKVFRSSLVTRLLRTVFLSKKGAATRIQSVWRRAIIWRRKDVRLLCVLAVGRVAASRLINAVVRRYLARRVLRRRLISTATNNSAMVARHKPSLDHPAREPQQQQPTGASPLPTQQPTYGIAKAARLSLMEQGPVVAVDRSKLDLYFPPTTVQPGSLKKVTKTSLPSFQQPISVLDQLLADLAVPKSKVNALGPVREAAKRRSIPQQLTGPKSPPPINLEQFMAELKSGGGSAAMVLKAAI